MADLDPKHPDVGVGESVRLHPNALRHALTSVGLAHPVEAVVIARRSHEIIRVQLPNGLEESVSEWEPA